ncbi:hypothetical protein JXJ21_05380 [candidate division KSB1 bacterium]|nr:hypothetical protein [candidate division KSB1 bacterium]
MVILYPKIVIFGFFIMLFQVLIASVLLGQPVKWHVFMSKTQAEDRALQLAVEDLKTTASQFGIELKLVSDAKKLVANSIIVGNTANNTLTASLCKEGLIELSEMEDPQGYEILITNIDGKKVLLCAGGSVSGDVYGLYWIWDRLRIKRCIPDISVKHIPGLKIRYAGGGSKEALRDALRYRATWVTAPFSVNQLVPWDAEPERSQNEVNREQAREFIDYAHQLHLKVLVYEDEFSYHPSLMEEFKAKPTPSDPLFWDVVQAKYRRLLQIMPELDGIRIRTGESTRIGGNFKGIDVMHEGEDCDWSLAKRYRTYVRKMHTVIVGEFDKIYFQRTWVTSIHEQHSQAQVYREIFTDEVPTEKLYLSPYLSQTDRFFHQPYNPTFNQTPHDMVVLLATLDYHARTGNAVFPCFPGQYYQGGMQTILMPKSNNLKGSMFGLPRADDWDTQTVTAYTASRLSWNPYDDLESIARDLAAMHFGEKVADRMAEILLQSPVAYKYGIYIEPVAYGDFRSLPHLRLTNFSAKGFPRLDSGKQHIDFLRQIYLRCKPWLTETLMYLDHGLNVATEMTEKFQTLKHDIDDAQLAGSIENSLELTRMLIQTNTLYVKTFFAYFAFQEQPSDISRQQLYNRSLDLKKSMSDFLETPGCDYELAGMEQLLKNVEQMLEDPETAMQRLRDAPAPEEINLIIAREQEKYIDALKIHSEKAVKFLHWRGRVDGRDLILVKGDTLKVKHLRYDPIQEMSHNFLKPLPAEAVTIIPRDIQSRSFHPFVLEQPSAENDFTATIYLSDYPCTGYSWWEFELYYIPQSPEALGLQVPWK